MPGITTTDLNNAKTDVDKISEFMESSSSTMTTRLGATIQTRAGLAATFPNAEPAAAAAAISEANAAASEDASATSAMESAASAVLASQSSSNALTASATAGAYPSTAASNVPRGLTQASVGAITAGSGGTNGTFALGWSGGNFEINPTGTFTVSGGAVTAVTITGPGLYIGASPTVPTPSFTASAGLTGAAVALTAQFLVTSGQGYWVKSSNGLQLDRYKNVSGVATSDTANVPSLPAVVWIDDAFHERFFASQARSLEEKRTRVFTLRKLQALILIGLGQSNNAAYNTPVSGTVTSSAVQFVGGNAVGDHDFYATNQAHSVNWADVASTVAFTTGSTEHPLTGAITMLEGLFPKIYAHSAAYGGNAILMLSGAARLANLCAYVHKMCDHARADGYEPVVAFTFVQGEANMSSFGLLTEANYYTYLHQYLRIAQRIAAQAMDRPDYKAPIVLHNPAQSQNGADSRGINNAIGRVAAEIPNGILGGGLNQWNVNADLIHGTAVGFRQRGEQDGWLLSKYFAEGRIFKGLYPVDAYRSGASLVVTFDDEFERDATATFGSSLNASFAYAGGEYTYDGTNYVQLTGVTVSGRRATFTLASNPGAAAGTEEFRLAMQTSAASGTWPQQAAGSQFRSTRDRFVSPYDGTTQYVWASPRKLSVRAA